MDLRGWLQQWLGINDLHQQVAELDRRIAQIDTDVTSILQHFGNYRNRTDGELTLMRDQLETMLETVSNVIESVENQADRQRAIGLRRRLKNNLGRVNSVYNSRFAS